MPQLGLETVRGDYRDASCTHVCVFWRGGVREAGVECHELCAVSQRLELGLRFGCFGSPDWIEREWGRSEADMDACIVDVLSLYLEL